MEENERVKGISAGELLRKRGREEERRRGREEERKRGREGERRHFCAEDVDVDSVALFPAVGAVFRLKQVGRSGGQLGKNHGLGRREVQPHAASCHPHNGHLDLHKFEKRDNVRALQNADTLLKTPDEKLETHRTPKSKSPQKRCVQKP